MWLTMMSGMQLFIIHDHHLVFEVAPLLPADFFDAQDEVRFTLFGDMSVIYHNPGRKNTYGVDQATVDSYTLNYHSGKIEVMESVVGQHAHDIRNNLVKKIDVLLK